MSAIALGEFGGGASMAPNGARGSLTTCCARSCLPWHDNRAGGGRDRIVITGMHAIVFSPEAEKVRAFFAEVLGMASVDAGGGRLISSCPQPSWLCIQPTVSLVTSFTSCVTASRRPSPS